MRERTVLVVDDDQSVREFLAAVLALPDLADVGPLRVLTAPNAEAALGRIDGHRPDLVLLDILLPGADGFDLCRRLRADPRLRSVPVVALSALGWHEGAEERARTAGFDAFLPKPVELDDLIAAVHRWLRS